MWKTSFAIVLSLLSIRGFADNRPVGNGGHAVVCSESGSTSVELLDFFEAKFYDPIDLGAPELPVAHKIEVALSRLKPYNSTLELVFRNKAKEFFESVSFRERVELPDTKDTGEVLLDENCVLKQLAMQKFDHFPGEPFYVVDKKLWEKLDNNHKAGLVLHEVIYGTFGPLGFTDSKFSRYFNAMLSSKRIEKYSKGQYDGFLLAAANKIGVHYLLIELGARVEVLGTDVHDSHELKFEEGTMLPILVNGKKVLVSFEKADRWERGAKVEKSSSGWVAVSGRFTTPVELVFGKHRAWINGYARVDMDEGDLVSLQSFDLAGCTVKADGWISFGEQGHLAMLGMRGDEHRSQTLCVAGRKIKLRTGDERHFDFFENEQVQYGIVDEPTSFPLFDGEVLLKGWTSFHESGVVESSSLARDAVLTSQDGSKVELKAGQAVTFSAEGKLQTP